MSIFVYSDGVEEKHKPTQMILSFLDQTFEQTCLSDQENWSHNTPWDPPMEGFEAVLRRVETPHN